TSPCSGVGRSRSRSCWPSCSSSGRSASFSPWRSHSRRTRWLDGGRSGEGLGSSAGSDARRLASKRNGFSELPSEEPFFSFSPAPLGRGRLRFRFTDDGDQRELGRVSGRRPPNLPSLLLLDLLQPFLDFLDIARLIRHSILPVPFLHPHI